MFWAWVIGIVTMPYQWVRDWLQDRRAGKSGSEERGRRVRP
jgi:hypothetical protein